MLKIVQSSVSTISSSDMQKSKGLMSKPLKVGGRVKMEGSSTLRVHQLTYTHTHTHTYLLVTRSQKSIIIIVDKHLKKERNPNIKS